MTQTNSLEKRDKEILEIESLRDKEMDRQVYKELESDNKLEENRNVDKKKEEKNTKIKRIIYYTLGVLESLLAFRFVFKILGASPESTFVSAIYSSTSFILTPFTGIFRMAVTDGIETQSVLEPHLIIGMIVYALLAWGIVKLIEIISNHKDVTTSL